MSTGTSNSAATAALLTGVSATSNPPTDGATTTDGKRIPRQVDEADILVDGTSSGGTLEVTIRIWLFSPFTNKWYPAGPGGGVGAANTQGLLNGGAKFEEIASDVLKGYEKLENLRNFTRAYAQVVAISGTSPVINCTLVPRSPKALS